MANLLPAAVEADHGGLPLLLLSADRPARLKDCGANQAVNQEAFLLASCRWAGKGPADGLAQLAASAVEALADQAWAAALHSPPGAVRLNHPFEEPLHADGPLVQRLQQTLQARIAAPEALPPLPAPAPAGEATVPSAAITGLDPGQSGVIIAGPWRGRPSQWQAWRNSLHRWQQATGWPLLADPLSGLRGDPWLRPLLGYDLFLEPSVVPQPSQVLRLGPLPASRRLQRWLERFEGPQGLVSEGDPRPLDPLRSVQWQCAAGLTPWVAGQALTDEPPAPASLELAAAWRQAETLVAEALTVWSGAQEGLSEPLLAHRLSRLLPAGMPLMLANSSPVRDWETFADGRAPHRPIVGFRGASGIDGTLSEACGLAIGWGAAVLVTGDLALLHDSNGWLWQQRLAQLGARLTVVLLDN
ncbi:MAG: 2-succinyl-5-enolpyruvyl-6-hydroxy-3-cyclohexene-1-carboxylic-acid synthase, partial [Cyanobacteriota bacterium]